MVKKKYFLEIDKKMAKFMVSHLVAGNKEYDEENLDIVEGLEPFIKKMIKKYSDLKEHEKKVIDEYKK